jgi:histidinol-phosphate phosphatase family protein
MTNGGFQVAILAGGQGTRLRARIGDGPKPMVPVKSKPLLQHQLELCREHGFTDILLLLHYRHEVVQAAFGDGSALGLRLGYEIETSPRGTAGALRDALPRLASRFLVLYGDTFLDVDLHRLWRVHNASGADATLFLHPNDHPHDSDVVSLDADGSVREIHPYPHPPGADLHNLVNAALYVMERDGLQRYTSAEGQADIAKHMFPAMLAAGRRLHGHVSPEYIKDVGTPQRLDKVERDIDAGVVERLSGRELRAAVFLDRDGTINREVEHLRDAAQLELLPGATEAIRRLNQSGRLAVVVTNQPVLARGDVTQAELDRIHARLETQLGHGGAYLDGLYLCPHHPDRGFAGEVLSLKIECECRKPEPGLIDRACRDLHIERAKSWLVGDTTADIECGRRAGVRTVLVCTGHAGRDDKRALQPDYVMPDLPAAVDWILRSHGQMCRRLAPAALAASNGARVVLVAGLARSGKGCAAQVLKDLLAGLDVTAHLVSLDSWLRPVESRPEGAGVLQRYDMEAATQAIGQLAASRSRSNFTTPVYDRQSRAMHRHSVRQSVGPGDVLIVEGVTALLWPPLRALAQLAVFLDLPEHERLDRLQSDYAWRGVTGQALDAVLHSRAKDEHDAVAACRSFAQFFVSSEAQA